MAERLRDKVDVVLTFEEGTGLSVLRALVDDIPASQFYSSIAKVAESIGSKAFRLRSRPGNIEASGQSPLRVVVCLDDLTFEAPRTEFM